MAILGVHWLPDNIFNGSILKHKLGWSSQMARIKIGSVDEMRRFYLILWTDINKVKSLFIWLVIKHTNRNKTGSSQRYLPLHCLHQEHIKISLKHQELLNHMLIIKYWTVRFWHVTDCSVLHGTLWKEPSHHNVWNLI